MFAASAIIHSPLASPAALKHAFTSSFPFPAAAEAASASAANGIFRLSSIAVSPGPGNLVGGYVDGSLTAFRAACPSSGEAWSPSRLSPRIMSPTTTPGLDHLRAHSHSRHLSDSMAQLSLRPRHVQSQCTNSTKLSTACFTRRPGRPSQIDLPVDTPSVPDSGRTSKAVRFSDEEDDLSAHGGGSQLGMKYSLNKRVPTPYLEKAMWLHKGIDRVESVEVD